MTLAQFQHHILPLKQKLYRFAYSLLKNPADAQDIVQEVMLKSWKTLGSLDQVKNIEAWCMTATRNASLDFLRKRSLRETSPLNASLEKASLTPGPGAILEGKDIHKALEEVMAQLPTAQQTVLQLRDMEGYSNQEIAEIMHVEPGHIRVLLSRARGQVRKQLKDLYHELG